MAVDAPCWQTGTPIRRGAEVEPLDPSAWPFSGGGSGNRTTRCCKRSDHPASKVGVAIDLSGGAPFVDEAEA